MSTLSKPFGNFFLSLQRDSRESSVTGTTLKTAKMKDEETKENNNENPNVKTFIIDDSLKSVQTVK